MLINNYKFSTINVDNYRIYSIFNIKLSTLKIYKNVYNFFPQYNYFFLIKNVIFYWFFNNFNVEYYYKKVGDILDLDILWKKFLDRIKPELQDVNYETWFEDTKLIEIKDNYAKVLVPMALHKKQLKDKYNDMITSIFYEITETNFQMIYLTNDELENNIIIDTNEIGIPNEPFETNLDPKYTFDNFVCGKSNKFAKANAVAIAERPGQVYNPLFIYGPSGVGKTHLMQAIGNYIVKNSNKKVLYCTCEKFVNEFLKHYSDKKENGYSKTLDDFKNKFRTVDVLIIDDIQYFEVAKGTQQEFFNTFNELHSNGKQIIISSDRSPSDLKKLEDRLLTRFSWGISVDIMPPDFDLRMGIISNKIKNNEISVDFPLEVQEFIAGICTTDIRTLEGYINRLLSYAAIMNGSNITLELAEEALAGHIGKPMIAKNKINQLQQLIAHNYNITVEDLRGKKRKASIAYPRQIAMYICRAYLEEPLARIGSEFGGKDHTTVMHSVNKISKEVKTNKELLSEIEKIANQIR